MYISRNDGQVNAPSRERAPVQTHRLEVPVVMRQTVLEAVYRYGDTVAGVSRGGAYRCPACGKVLALRNHDGSVAARCGRARWVLQTGRQVVTCWGDDCHALVAITAGEAADAA